MTWKENVLLELGNLERSLSDRKVEIEVGVDNLEERKKSRDKIRKEILLLEMKHSLARLNEIDKKVTKDFKAEAFDVIRSISKVAERVVQLRESIKDAPENGGIMKTQVNVIRGEIDKLGIEEFSKCIDISVCSPPGSMTHAFERVPDAIYLITPSLNPKNFCLQVALIDPTLVDVKIYLAGENQPSSFSSSLLLQKLTVTMTCHLPGGGVRVVEESSVLSKIEKKKAVMSEDGGHIAVQMKRPSNMFGHISVHLLGSNILNSPLHLTFSSETPAANNITMGNDTIGIFDTTGLDQSDINSLDMTARQQQQHILPPWRNIPPNPILPVSPALRPLMKMSRQPNVSPVPELVQAPVSLTNTFPFSPYSEGRVSTMRATAAASQLASALHHNQLGMVDHFDESNLSVLAPSKTSALVIDDIQRSLSSSESGGGDVDKSLAQLDRSVRFAPQTQVVEVLSSPVEVDGDMSIFSVAHGQTKSRDGQTGPVRRVAHIWNTDELDTETVGEYPEQVIDEYNSTTLPVINASESCFRPNNSKAHLPSSQSAWANWADSIWEGDDCQANHDENCFDDNDDEEYNAHPHLLLNASKAPDAGADWSSVDPSWDINASLLPQSCFNKSVLPSQSQDIDQTIWESSRSQDSRSSGVDIRQSSLNVTDVYEAHTATSTASRGTTRCLLSPHSIAYLPYVNYFLVTEPDQNRVGLYEAETFRFYCWLQYPQQYANDRKHYTYPTSVLSLTNGCVALVERNKLHVFDQNIRPLFAIQGVFQGLAEGPNSQILTLGKNKDGHNLIKRFARTRYRYKWAGQIPIRAVKEFENWETLSKLRFLHYNQNKVFITDQGLHKIFIVDLVTGKQVAKGYLGENPGQLKQPTGILADDTGNILVGDSGNDRLGVYTNEGVFVKLAGFVEWRFMSPHGLVRLGNLVYAVFSGGKEGAIVKYTVQEDSGDNMLDTE